MSAFRGDRIAAYARYSSDKQSDSSIEDQVRRLREHAVRQGRQLDEKLILADYAISGSSTNRPSFDALMGMVRRREIDVLLVESVDRLSRNAGDAHRLREELAFNSVQLIAVADGIDTSARGSKMQFAFKSLMSDMYLDDLSDKTKRGMDGRAHAGLSTGGRALGYRTVPIIGPDGRTPQGARIEIDPVDAAIVKRIFDAFVAGGSFNGIAQHLNRDQVPSPRDRTRHTRKGGWGGSSVRAILMNERYRGVCVFGVRKWVKVPGTGKRVPQARDASEVIRQERPELRIVDEVTWEQTAERLAATRALFTIGADGRRKGKTPRTDHVHVLSGLICCDACKAPMTIAGTRGGRRYYACPIAKNGRCAATASVREDIALASIMEELREVTASPNAIARLRRTMAQLIGGALRANAAELKERRGRLERTEKRVANVIDAIASGERSQALSDALRDLEAQSGEEKRAIAALEATQRAPVALPDPAVLVERCAELETKITTNPSGAREELRALFKGRVLTLELGPDGIYTARGSVMPLVLLARGRTLDSQTPPLFPGGAFYGRSSGGRISRPENAELEQSFSKRLERLAA